MAVLPDRGFLTVVLTSHALNPEILMESIQKGAIAYLSKEKLSELHDLLDKILGVHKRDEPAWKLIFEELNFSNDNRISKFIGDEALKQHIAEAVRNMFS